MELRKTTLSSTDLMVDSDMDNPGLNWNVSSNITRKLPELKRLVVQWLHYAIFYFIRHLNPAISIFCNKGAKAVPTNDLSS